MATLLPLATINVSLILSIIYILSILLSDEVFFSNKKILGIKRPNYINFESFLGFFP